MSDEQEEERVTLDVEVRFQVSVPASEVNKYLESEDNDDPASIWWFIDLWMLRGNYHLLCPNNARERQRTQEDVDHYAKYVDFMGLEVNRED